jgi:hypothetical protein
VWCELVVRRCWRTDLLIACMITMSRGPSVVPIVHPCPHDADGPSGQVHVYAGVYSLPSGFVIIRSSWPAVVPTTVLVDG